MTDNEQAIEELNTFVNFADAQKNLQEHLVSMLATQGITAPAKHIVYLAEKISENLTMIFQKNFNDPRNWQSLSSFTAMGGLHASAAQEARARHEEASHQEAANEKAVKPKVVKPKIVRRKK
jgi:bisphosphoglycerate-independent phosphoglycerate mutase (AlkP superfamily)